MGLPILYLFGEIQDFNDLINIGQEEGMCDSTGFHIGEFPVEVSEEHRFFGTHIRELIRFVKSLWRK